MVQIAEHCKPGGWRGGYELTCVWPEDCYVQWGSPSHPFFEAFPNDNAGGYIRAEGFTLQDAERLAYRKWCRQVECLHRWCRQQWDNGGAMCPNCGAFKTVFRPIYKMGEWKRPITRLQDQFLALAKDDPGFEKTWRKIQLRKKLFGVEDKE